MHLALSVMEASRARPTVRAAENAAGAMKIAHTRQFRSEDVERLFPRHSDEAVAAASQVRPRSAIEPAAAHHRLRNPCRVSQGRWEILQDTVGIRIGRMRSHLELAILPARRKCPPVRCVRDEISICIGHVCGRGGTRHRGIYRVDRAIWRFVSQSHRALAKSSGLVGPSDDTVNRTRPLPIQQLRHHFVTRPRLARRCTRT